MNNPRRQFSQEYKQEAVALVRQSNEPISQVARNLGINDGVYADGSKSCQSRLKKPFLAMAALETKKWFASSVSLLR